MKTLADYQQDPFLIFAFPEYRDDACYIMLAESAIQSLEKAKNSVKSPVEEATVPVPYLELIGMDGVENDANVKLGKGVGVITAYRLWNYGVDEDTRLDFVTGACETYDLVRLQLRENKNGCEFRAVGTSDYEGLKGGAYEYTPWIPLEKLADAAEKTARMAADKENFESE
jgi:hypothetical protein